MLHNLRLWPRLLYLNRKINIILLEVYHVAKDNNVSLKLGLSCSKTFNNLFYRHKKKTYKIMIKVSDLNLNIFSEIQTAALLFWCCIVRMFLNAKFDNSNDMTTDAWRYSLILKKIKQIFSVWLKKQFAITFNLILKLIYTLVES